MKPTKSDATNPFWEHVRHLVGRPTIQEQRLDDLAPARRRMYAIRDRMREWVDYRWWDDVDGSDDVPLHGMVGLSTDLWDAFEAAYKEATP